ncbi:MAG: cryptochrome/photolyase family protein [Trueperaceae bacterium]|nr:cryptochrome/photolyase family protein [Trueperaceae bacterium]
MSTTQSTTHILVLGDQLTRQVGPLADADPNNTSVLMVESLALAHELRHHKQKLVLVFSAMRHFARELAVDGFNVEYKTADSFADGIEKYLNQYRGVTLAFMQPNDYGYDTMLSGAIERAGGKANIVPNGLWLSSAQDFDAWAEGKKELRMEFFYRQERRRTGWLMEDGEPVGGTWNLDEQNRDTPEPDHTFPDPPHFAPDDLTREVIDFVEAEVPDHFGTTDGFAWPVTREQALAALEDFCENRLRAFGPFEDAMVQGEYVLYHSMLSVSLNLGLLTPREVCETALRHYHDRKNDDERRKIPLNSIEGFVRQVSGWREFMHQVYRRLMPEFRDENRLNHTRDLPEFYWSGDTKMNCLHQCVTQAQETGHNHHIQRLMVLGNFAQIAGVNPQQLTDWFTACFVDALDWVMVPNVIGMSQYADLGTFTSKPYAASANYINKMSDYCGSCHYSRTKKLGENACPFNSLYWDFLDRHYDTFNDNPRMNLTMANWKRRDEASKDEIREQARDVLARLDAGAL